MFQFFYHCKGEELPVRDFLDRQHHGHKTEPHYENLTENWCSRCMPGRIKSANRHQVEYLFLVTTFRKAGHPRDGKRLVVGFLHRAPPARWSALNAGLRRGATRFRPTQPDACEFFAGDSESHFVAADDAFDLAGLANPRWKYFADKDEAQKILRHLLRSPNILEKLRRMVIGPTARDLSTPAPCKHQFKKRNGTC